jgi:hypothetical protein
MDLYSHIRVLFSMVIGLAVAHLLGGVSRIVQHPKKYRVYWVHLVWFVFFFLYLVHFWWWEFRLSRVTLWTFPLYFFIAIYATLLYLECTLLFPQELSDYAGFEDYFYARKNWIFGLMALLMVVDLADTLIKGLPYLKGLGFVYYFRTASLLVLSIVAIPTNKRWFQSAFAIFAVICEITLILAAYLRFG